MEEMIHETTRCVCGAYVYCRAQARKRPQLLSSFLAVGATAPSEGRKPTVKLWPCAPCNPDLNVASCGRPFRPLLFCNVEMGERGHWGSIGVRAVTLGGAPFLHGTAVSASQL